MTSTREPGRPVRRRTRTFRPNYVSFSGTYQCNLTCAHCSVPIEWPDRLGIDVALRFLDSCAGVGVETLAFTGGEPFLYPEFVLALTQRGAELGMRFDKVQTNGVWHRDEAHLSDVLTRLRDAGFTGKLGLSVDKFHGKHTAKAAEFCRVARRVFGRDNVVSLSYASRHPDQGLEPVRELCDELGGILDWSELLHRYMIVSDELTLVLNWNHLAPVERAENLAGGWDGTWFEEDYCEGPGQAFIVTPKGDVKPCCGFASDRDELTIGNIHSHSAKELVERGRAHPLVGTIFREGLTAVRERVEADHPGALPGATSNHCFFCWYVLAKELVEVGDEHRGDARKRVPLPMLGVDTRPSAASLLMLFDGRRVYLGSDLPEGARPGRGEVYVLKIAGEGRPEVPASPMDWNAYQAWVDETRAKGFVVTTEGVGCARAGA